MKTTCSYNGDSKSQQNKQERNKIKIGIFTAIFLIQYICLHGILPFSKSIESTFIKRKVHAKKVFRHVILHSYLCNVLCRFSSNKIATNVFQKHILKSKARDQPIQARKKLFCHVIVENALQRFE